MSIIKNETDNSHKEPITLVKELYENFKNNTLFNECIDKESEEKFTALSHMGLGMTIRNKYGFWTKDTDLYNWFIANGIEHPDDMSHVILSELYKYTKNMKN